MLSARAVTLILFGLFSAQPVFAQLDDDFVDPDTLQVGAWGLGLSATLSASQAAYQNWQEGGINTLAFTSRIDGSAIRRGQIFQQRHDLRMAFGQVKQDTLEFRKAADQMFYALSVTYLLPGVFSPTAALEFRSQFAPGFNYDENPFGDDRTLPVKVSDMLAPAYVTQSLGLAYEPHEWFRVRLGLGAKQTVVLINRLRPLYGVPPEDAARFQFGLESRTDFQREIFENVLLRSRLGLFAAFDDAELPDAMWENSLRMKVNDWLNVDLDVTSYYDADVTRRIQLRQILSLGVSIAIF